MSYQLASFGSGQLQPCSNKMGFHSKQIIQSSVNTFKTGLLLLADQMSAAGGVISAITWEEREDKEANIFISLGKKANVFAYDCIICFWMETHFSESGWSWPELNGVGVDLELGSRLVLAWSNNQFLIRWNLGSIEPFWQK